MSEVEAYLHVFLNSTLNREESVLHSGRFIPDERVPGVLGRKPGRIHSGGQKEMSAETPFLGCQTLTTVTILIEL
jgi:hypothetical protein